MCSQPAANSSRFTFTMGDTPLLVVRFEATEQISALFSVRLRLAGQQMRSVEKSIRQPAVLTIERGEEDRCFHGMVHHWSTAGRRGRFYLYEATLMPVAALLALRRDCRIFQQQSVPDIVTQVLKQAGITNDLFAFRLKHRYAVRDYCVQYRETDLDFIRRLLAEEGIFFFFEHHADRHTMVFGDSTVNYAPIAGSARIAFNPASGTVAETDAVLEFKRGQRMVSGKYTQRDFNYEKPALDLTGCHSAGGFDHLERYDYPGGCALPEPAARRAKIRRQAAAMDCDQAMGKSVVARFCPAKTFTLTGSPADGFDDTYLLTKVVHTGKQPQVLAELADTQAGTVYLNRFDAIPATVPFRPGGKWLEKPMVRGTQTATVTGPAGEEIYTDRLGRIKVQFHWDRQGKMDERSSCWVRVSQASAGAGWGAMHIPRIGQEVIVNFVEGDPDRPIVTGCVHHADNPAPLDLPAQKSRSTIRSNTTPGGGGANEICFEDQKGDEQVYVHGQKDWNTVVENDKGQHIGHDETLEVANNRTKTVGKDQQEHIGASRRIDVAQNHDETIGADKSIRVGGDHSESIAQNADITIGGHATCQTDKSGTFEIGEDRSVKVNASADETVTGSKTAKVGKTLKTHSAEQIITFSDTKITIESGGAKVVISKNGTVSIKTHSLSVEADGGVSLKAPKVNVTGPAAPSAASPKAASMNQAAPAPEAPESETNWVDLEYLYADGSGVASAGYEVSDAGGSVLATGRMNSAGKARANIPLAASHVQVRYFNDPRQVAILKQSHPKPVPATPGWFDRMAFALKETWQVTKDGAQWTWGVIEGDFNENQSVGQIITNAAVTAIPGIDQAGDARDIAAAVKLMAWDGRHKELGTWFMLAATIIGLVPIAGSLAKGVLKLIWKGARLDRVVAVFNHFAKGNAIAYLKALRSGKLKSFMDDAAPHAHNILDSIMEKMDALKVLIPRRLKWLREELSKTQTNLSTAKGLIDEKFAEMTELLHRKLDRMLAEGLDNVQSGSNRGVICHRQSAQQPDKLDDLATKDYDAGSGGVGPRTTPKPKTIPSRTEPTGVKGGKPSGKKTEIKGSSDLKRSLKRENESAELLANNGYKVEQNPRTLPNGRNPDYKIEGEYVDCYAPKTDNIGKIRNKISKKVKNEQADRIVVNLDDCKFEPKDIADILKSKPKDGLNEVIGIKNGEVTQIFP